MKKRQAERGFSVVEVLIVVVVLFVVAAAGFFVWQKNQHKPAVSQKLKTDASTSAKKTPVVLKTYTNDEYGFSFQYPETWKLTADLSDSGRGHNEGDVVVTSPNGTKVHFGPNLGGKGGECADLNDNYTTQTCSTLTVLSLEKLSNGSAKQMYFYHFSLTDSLDNDGKTVYYIGIGSGSYAPTETGSFVGDFTLPRNILDAGPGYVTVYVEGKNDSSNNSAAFFDTPEVREATPILKSFKLY